MINVESLVPPKKKSTYLYADFVELLCLISPDKAISKNDAMTRTYHDIGTEIVRETEAEEGVLTEEEEHIYSFKDAQIQTAEDWFSHLDYRQSAFKEYYPFYVDKDCLFLHDNLNLKQKIYIFLLLCSSLYFINKTDEGTLTTDFEQLSTKAMESYLPSFVVHPFGKSEEARKHYPNKLIEAINQLAINLRERNIVDQALIGAKNTGDGGLDIVAWKHPLGDEHASGSLICLAQCACSATDWVKKQAESHYINWDKRIHFTHRPANFMFIPFCFRDSLGNWYNSDKITQSIVMDRLRLCFLSDEIDIAEFASYEAVEAVISYKAPLYS